ncbi:MAG: pilus assembly FimT family protein [Terriglobia bacterium]
MTCIIARLNYLSRNRAPSPPLRNSGYALVTLMIMVAVLLVSLTAALPSLYQAAQREREQEAIFRGDQYARAAYLFYRKFGRYPTSVKDLLNTDGIRFLREPYRDPLSRSGRWRFIHVVGGGILIDSWNQTTLVPGLANGGASAAGSLAGSSNMGAASHNAAPASTSDTGNPANGKPKHPPSTCDAKGNNSPDQSSDTSYQTGTLLGAFIVGVAPCSDLQSIRVIDHQDHYDHWEFIGLKYQEYVLPKSSTVGNTPAAPSLMAPSNQPGSTGQTGPMGSPAGTNGSNAPGPGNP